MHVPTRPLARVQVASAPLAWMPLKRSRFSGIWLISVFVFALMTPAVLAQDATTGGSVVTEALSIDFGDFQSDAELTYPADAEGPFPTIILIPGSGPEDMNAAIFSFGADGQPVLLSSIFKDVSSYLSAHGFAVLRYNKHYVTGPGQADYQSFYTKLDLPQMLADAEKVLATAKANARVDQQQLFLFGWSEGSAIAAAMAAEHPDLAGLVVQGPVTGPWRDLFMYQILSVGMPYLRQVVPDERVDVEALRAMQTGDSGLVAKGILNYIGDPTEFQQGKLAVNKALDTNADGVLDRTELTPEAFGEILDTLIAPNGFQGIYSVERALPGVTQQAPNLAMPVLILQGANDASVPPSGSEALAAALETAGNADVTLHMYPDLGHSLGETSSVIADNFQPIAQQPLADLLEWLEGHAATQ